MLSDIIYVCGGSHWLHLSVISPLLPRAPSNFGYGIVICLLGTSEGSRKAKLGQGRAGSNVKQNGDV